MIWEYANNSELELSAEERKSVNVVLLSGQNHRKTLQCQYCQSEMANLSFQQPRDFSAEGGVQSHVEACPSCGWWVLTHYSGYAHGSYEGALAIHRAAGVLRNLDVTDISVPTDDLARYLIARYDSRFWMNPKRYEDIVAGVFQDFSYRVSVTSYSGDDGIDVFVLDGDHDRTVGVQVKRYRGKVEAEQIRAFAGALCLNGLTSGVFVTTSDYTKGARHTSRRYKEVGLAIDLWDAEHFYDRLQISKRMQFTSVDDPNAPYFHLSRHVRETPLIYSLSW